MRCATQRERQNNRYEKNAYGVVPVKKFKPVVLHAFIGIGPGTPADRARNHHQQSDSEIVGNKHLCASWSGATMKSKIPALPGSRQIEPLASLPAERLSRIRTLPQH